MSVDRLTIALAQANFIVGALQHNSDIAKALHSKANTQNADLVIFSEMAITGYPPEDLVLRPQFQEDAMQMARQLAPLTLNGTAMLIGTIWREGEHLYNAAMLLDEGVIQHIICKFDLPNYGVFDEKRVFTGKLHPKPIDFRGVSLGVMICEDMWQPYVSDQLKQQGADMLITLNASPFESGKLERRYNIACQRVGETSLPLIYVNPVGGQDELVFEGGSFIVNSDKQAALQMPRWQEALHLSMWQKDKETWFPATQDIAFDDEPLHAIYEALKLGLRDYVEKNGFSGVVLGMSGGIDSALTAAIACDALGQERVKAVMMPYQFTSEESLRDAQECVSLLKMKHYSIIPIEATVKAFHTTLEKAFANTEADTTEENIQSRIRGNILMALSNKFGDMVLTTGNKSEMAVGYATLYGDMCGGFNVLKDIYKTHVYELATWRNQHGYVIPDNIITKTPTAELRPDQTDQDSLPSYEVLDDILTKMIEQRLSAKQIAETGHPKDTVDKVIRLVKLAEYKRRQAPPGVKITALAFGRDRRYPITNGYQF